MEPLQTTDAKGDPEIMQILDYMAQRLSQHAWDVQSVATWRMRLDVWLTRWQEQDHGDHQD